jgi:hypothetical protein
MKAMPSSRRPRTCRQATLLDGRAFGGARPCYRIATWLPRGCAWG